MAARSTSPARESPNPASARVAADPLLGETGLHQDQRAPRGATKGRQGPFVRDPEARGDVACTTTSGSSWMACWCPGPCRRGRASTRPTSGWPFTSRTIPLSTDRSKARSRRNSTARAPSSSGTTAPGSRSAIRAKGLEGQAGLHASRTEAHRPRGSWCGSRKPGDKQDPWMLFKKRDEFARPHGEYDVVTALPDSVDRHAHSPAKWRASLREANRAQRRARAAMPAGAVKAALARAA